VTPVYFIFLSYGIVRYNSELNIDKYLKNKTKMFFLVMLIKINTVS
jgi:hypothetical protein